MDASAIAKKRLAYLLLRVKTKNLGAEPNVKLPGAVSPIKGTIKRVKFRSWQRHICPEDNRTSTARTL